MILLDTFEQGYHLATIVGEGGRINLATGLDRDKVYAGHRFTNYFVNGNPFGYTTTFEVGLGEARVTTPGPNDLSTELEFGYGKNFHSPLDLDLSAYTSPGRLFEVDLATDPPNLFAEIWSIRLFDGLGRSVTNERPGLLDTGIEFRRDGFVGSPDFDWSDVQTLSFRQQWNRTNTAPLSYWTTEIRAVPEPSAMLGLGALALAGAARARRRP